MIKGPLIAAAVGALVLLAAAIALLSTFASGALPWFVGVVLACALAGVIIAGFHAGGHGWFVPVPVLALAVAWAVAASAGGASSPLAWALAALAFSSALGGLALVAPAVAFRRAPGPPAGPKSLVGATGKALSALTPTGVCRVNNETWTAESLSGPLPAGAPVHVARVEGLRLLVWSEAGTVLGPEALDAGGQTVPTQAGPPGGPQPKKENV